MMLKLSNHIKFKTIALDRQVLSPSVISIYQTGGNWKSAARDAGLKYHQ